MRTPDRRWTDELRRRFGDQVKLSWNVDVGRWQFDVQCVDMQYRPQFLQWTHDPKTGQKLKADPQTGLLPFRELTDETFREVCRNLERTYLANPFDGGQTARGHLRKVQRFNDDLKAQRDRDLRREGEAYFRDHHRQLTGGLLVGGARPTPTRGGIEVVSPIGTPKEA